MNKALAILEKGREYKYPIGAILFGLLTFIFSFTAFVFFMLSSFAIIEGESYMIFFIPLVFIILAFIFGALLKKYGESKEYAVLMNEKGKTKRVYVGGNKPSHKHTEKK